MSSFGVVRVARVAIGGGGVTIIASGGFGVRVVVGICGPARKSHLACDLADRDRWPVSKAPILMQAFTF